MEKVLLVTGASAGIGASVATMAATAGYSVCINYNKNHEKAEALAERIRTAGVKVITVKADVSVEADVLNLFDAIDSKLGVITHLVNNAGIIAPIKSFEETSLETLQALFSINVYGSFLCAREAVKRMSSKNGGVGGSIVNLSSAAARLGSPNEFIDYAARKGAIDTLTLGLSKEVAEYEIRVNAVRLGLIQTELHAHAGDASRPEKLKNYIPIKRPGSPDEVAETIIWLLSDSASYVTGALLDVAGGR
ncbi:MAG: SDR family oxidoreductase [Gammaproteobacteria bacterium]|nr:SDR family oxidoreductase [Gammaproteobacteria bacterium]